MRKKSFQWRITVYDYTSKEEAKSHQDYLKQFGWFVAEEHENKLENGFCYTVHYKKGIVGARYCLVKAETRGAIPYYAQA